MERISKLTTVSLIILGINLLVSVTQLWFFINYNEIFAEYSGMSPEVIPSSMVRWWFASLDVITITSVVSFIAGLTGLIDSKGIKGKLLSVIPMILSIITFFWSIIPQSPI